MLVLINNFDLNILALPNNSNDDYSITYRVINKEKAEKLIQFNHCRTILSNKEVVNAFNNKKKLKILNIDKIKLKMGDYVVVPIKDDKYLLFGIVKSKNFCKAILLTSNRT